MKESLKDWLSSVIDRCNDNCICSCLLGKLALTRVYTKQCDVGITLHLLVLSNTIIDTLIDNFFIHVDLTNLGNINLEEYLICSKQKNTGN